MSQRHDSRKNKDGFEFSTLAMVLLLAGATALGPFTIQIFVPTLPFIQREFGVEATTAALGLSLSLWAIAISNLLVGPLSDRFGRRPILLGGILVAVFGSFISAIAPNIEVLILGRVIQASGAASGMVVGRAVVRDRYDLETATSIIGKLTSVMMVAPMFAPLVAGVILDAAGWRFVFWVTLAICLIILLAQWWLLPESNTQRHVSDGVSLFRQSAGLFSNPMFRAHCFQTAFFSIMWFSFIASGPYLMSEGLGHTSTEYGLWFIAISFIFMAASFLAGTVGKRFGFHRALFGASLINLSGGVLAVGFAAILPLSALAIFLPVGVMLAGLGICMPSVQAAAMSVDPKRAGAASGVTAFIQMITAGLAAQVVGSLQDGTLWPMAISVLLGASGTVVFALHYMRLERRRHLLGE